MSRYKLKSTSNNEVKIKVLKSKIAYFLSLGIDLDDACKLTDCNKNFLGELRSDPEFEEFVQQCLVNREYEYLEAIKTAAHSGQWQAATWFLERKYPEKYGKRDTIVHEYNIKLQTLMNVFVGVVDEVAPHLKFEIFKKLRDYKFNGNEIFGGDGVGKITNQASKCQIVDV